MSQQRSNKRQLEQARQERAARKKQRRLDRAAVQPATIEPLADQPSTLDALTRLHESYEAGSIDFDEFESAKQDLIAQLRVD
jgi:hypothetical protein